MIDINKLEPGSRYEYDGKVYEVRLNARFIFDTEGYPCPECVFHRYHNTRYGCEKILDIIFGGIRTGGRTNCTASRIFIEVQE